MRRLKRIFCLLLATMMFAGLLAGCESITDTNLSVEITNFEADTFDVLVGESKQVKFTATVTLGDVDNITLIESENAIAVMNDDGKNGDDIADDNVYSCVITLEKQDRQNVEYYATYGESKSNSFEICYYCMLTEDDYKEFFDVSEQINQMSEFEKVCEYVKQSDDIEEFNIDEDNKTVTYVSASGITGCWSEETDDTKASGQYSVSETNGTDYTLAGENLLKMPTRPDNISDIAVIRPFRNSGFGYDDFEYAGEVLNTAFNKNLTICDDENADLDFFKTLNDYGIVLIDSHGTLANNTPYIVTGVYLDYNKFMWDIGYYMQNIEYTADFLSGRVIFTQSNHLAVGTKFFKKYYAGKSFNDSFIYLGICHGLHNDDLSNWFIDKGAIAVIGYTDEVCIQYCNDTMFEIIINSMLLSQDTVNIGVDNATSIYGENDPANSLCKLSCRGNPNYTFYSNINTNESIDGTDEQVNTIYLTSFSVPDSMVMTIGELGVIEPDAEPSDANGHSFKWTTSDDSIVQIASDSGEKCILTAKGKGTATVTAEATINGKTVSHSTEVRVASQARDTVLVLDVSGSMGGEPIEEMKKAAIQFCEELLIDEYNNRVGLVLYDNNIETYDLTNDVTALESYINGIVDGGTTNMEGGISCAIEMLDSLSTDDSIKNIVIMADGLPNEGNTSDSGSMAVSSSYSFYSTDILYANAVIDTAQSAMTKYNLYSLGFFHDLYGEEKDFAAALMQSLTNMNDGYHEVDKAENLQFAFGDLSEEISDGSKIVINIACPVDVSVSYQGEVLSSSQSNYNDKTSFGSLQLLGKNQDVKVVSVDADKVYDISLSGTDEGTMDYSVNYFDETENLVDSRSFTSIPITSTTNISSSTENSAEVSLNIDSDGDGISDIIYSAAQNSVGSVTWESEPETEPTTEPATEYTEPSTEVMGSSYNNGLETWQIILLVLGITVAVGVVIVAVVLVVTKEKSDDLYDIPVKPAIVNSELNDYEQGEPIETKPLAGKTAMIRILSGPMKGKEYNINFNENVLIGKKPGITEVLLSNDYEKVSRVHCTVNYSEKLNKFFVTDSSKNGTYYENHIRLVKGKRISIVPGSVILLADDSCKILLK